MNSTTPLCTNFAPTSAPGRPTLLTCDNDLALRLQARCRQTSLGLMFLPLGTVVTVVSDVLGIPVAFATSAIESTLHRQPVDHEGQKFIHCAELYSIACHASQLFSDASQQCSGLGYAGSLPPGDTTPFLQVVPPPNLVNHQQLSRAPKVTLHHWEQAAMKPEVYNTLSDFYNGRTVDGRPASCWEDLHPAITGKICRRYRQTGVCTYGSRCLYHHSISSATEAWLVREMERDTAAHMELAVDSRKRVRAPLEDLSNSHQ